MTCTEAEPLIGASLDGELDPRTALQVQNHVSECGRCSALAGRLERLHDEIAAAGLDWSASVDLRPLAARIRRHAPQESWWKRPWMWQSALATLAIAALVMVSLPGRRGMSVDRQIVDSHLRSLLADHLVDVPSSDRHTVKPWFQGKLNFAPPVPDLSGKGFVLIGGRLDVIDGMQAAAIIYKRREHVINLWITPGSGPDRGIESSSVDGFHLLRWQQDRMSYRTVSDMNELELREFAELIRAH
jgi:anti-sigma factor RsiW